MVMKNNEDVKRALADLMEADKAFTKNLETVLGMWLPKDVRELQEMIHHQTLGSVKPFRGDQYDEDVKKIKESVHAYLEKEEKRNQSLARNALNTAILVRVIPGHLRANIENFFVYVLLLFQRLRSGTGAAPSLTSLYRLFDWWPTKKLRERTQEMIVEAQVRITMFHKKGRIGVARWITFCTVVRCVWMIVKSPVTMVFSAVSAYLFGKPG
jgi:hypothetical protein